MALNFEPLKFVEGANLVVNQVVGNSLDATTEIDFQDAGVMFNLITDGQPDQLVFIPWSNIKDIRQ
jgi:hypothetical protein